MFESFAAHQNTVPKPMAKWLLEITKRFVSQVDENNIHLSQQNAQKIKEIILSHIKSSCKEETKMITGRLQTKLY